MKVGVEQGQTHFYLLLTSSMTIAKVVASGRNILKLVCVVSLAWVLLEISASNVYFPFSRTIFVIQTMLLKIFEDNCCCSSNLHEIPAQSFGSKDQKCSADRYCSNFILKKPLLTSKLTISLYIQKSLITIIIPEIK